MQTNPRHIRHCFSVREHIDGGGRANQRDFQRHHISYATCICGTAKNTHTEPTARTAKTYTQPTAQHTNTIANARTHKFGDGKRAVIQIAVTYYMMIVWRMATRMRDHCADGKIWGPNSSHMRINSRRYATMYDMHVRSRRPACPRLLSLLATTHATQQRLCGFRSGIVGAHTHTPETVYERERERKIPRCIPSIWRRLCIDCADDCADDAAMITAELINYGNACSTHPHT